MLHFEITMEDSIQLNKAPDEGYWTVFQDAQLQHVGAL